MSANAPRTPAVDNPDPKKERCFGMSISSLTSVLFRELSPFAGLQLLAHRSCNLIYGSEQIDYFGGDTLLGDPFRLLELRYSRLRGGCPSARDLVVGQPK